MKKIDNLNDFKKKSAEYNLEVVELTKKRRFVAVNKNKIQRGFYTRTGYIVQAHLNLVEKDKKL